MRHMRHQTLVRGVLGVALLLLVGGVALIAHALQDAAPVAGAVCPSPSSGATPLPTPVVGISPRNDCTPSFGERDVRAYLADSNHLGVLHGFTPVGQPEIASVQFLTVSALAHTRPQEEWTSHFPPDRVVCYVVLRGQFSTNNRDPLHRADTVNSAFILFDAHSGSFLAAGAFQQP